MVIMRRERELGDDVSLILNKYPSPYHDEDGERLDALCEGCENDVQAGMVMERAVQQRYVEYCKNRVPHLSTDLVEEFKIEAPDTMNRWFSVLPSSWVLDNDHDGRDNPSGGWT